MEIRTERLILRSWKDTDAESLYEYAKDPAVGPIAGWPVHISVENSLDIIRNVLSADETYAVCLKEDNRAIGSIGLIPPAQSHTKACDTEIEVGYWIGVPFWGNGYIPEAVRALQKHAFEDLGCTAMWCGYYDGNEKSKRCQEKCGFRYHHTEENKPCALMGDVRTEHFSYITKEQWREKVGYRNYRIINKNTYYRKGVFRHFSEDCKCSTSMTSRIDVTELVEYSKKSGTKFYLNFLYILTKVLNSRDDYKMGYLMQTDELICYDTINPTQYVFHEDTETCTPVYTMYHEDYDIFYRNAKADVERAKQTREYGLDMVNHPNWFDASYISWLSYDSLNIELPDGYLFFAPIVNWGKYRLENDRLVMPLSVRLNHAIADGYLVANVFRFVQQEMEIFCKR